MDPAGIQTAVHNQGQRESISATDSPRKCTVFPEGICIHKSVVMKIIEVQPSLALSVRLRLGLTLNQGAFATHIFPLLLYEILGYKQLYYLILLYLIISAEEYQRCIVYPNHRVTSCSHETERLRL